MHENRFQNKQRGFNVLLVLAALIALLVGAGFWKHQQQKAAELATAQQRQAEANQQAEADRQRKIAAEKVAFEAQLATENRKSAFDNAIAALNAQYMKWQDASRLAGTTARIALSQPVANLQAIKQETSALQVPGCLGAARIRLIGGMDLTIEGFMKFMVDKKSGEVSSGIYFDLAKVAFSDFESSAKSCRFE